MSYFSQITELEEASRTIGQGNDTDTIETDQYAYRLLAQKNFDAESYIHDVRALKIQVHMQLYICCLF